MISHYFIRNIKCDIFWTLKIMLPNWITKTNNYLCKLDSNFKLNFFIWTTFLLWNDLSFLNIEFIETLKWLNPNEANSENVYLFDKHLLRNGAVLCFELTWKALTSLSVVDGICPNFAAGATWCPLVKPEVEGEALRAET